MGNFTRDASQERWNSDEPIWAVMFISRNKDNKNLEGFRERRLTFLSTRVNDEEYMARKFKSFVNDGIDGEMSRMYVSVNSRNVYKSKKELLHYLIDNMDSYNLAALDGIAVKIAMKREMAAEKKRLFDIDINDESKVNEFVNDLYDRGATKETVDVHKTPNGYAVVIERGVDLRGLVDTMPNAKLKDKKDKGPWKWSKDEVSYKLDDLLLMYWATKNN
jgi:hypothetical protein